MDLLCNGQDTVLRQEAGDFTMIFLADAGFFCIPLCMIDSGCGEIERELSLYRTSQADIPQQQLVTIQNCQRETRKQQCPLPAAGDQHNHTG